MFTQSKIPRSSCEAKSSRSKPGSLSPHPQLEIPISDGTGSASTLGMWQFASVLILCHTTWRIDYNSSLKRNDKG